LVPEEGVRDVARCSHSVSLLERELLRVGNDLLGLFCQLDITSDHLQLPQQ